MEMKYVVYLNFILLASLLALPVKAQKKTVSSAPCSASTADKSVHMTSIKFWKIVQNQPDTLYFMNTDKCFIPNQKIQIFETKNSQNIIYWRADRGTVKIQKVENINYAEYKKREARQTTEKELSNFRNRLAAFTGKKGPELDATPLIAVTVVADKLTDSLKTYGSPRIHPVAKSLKKKEFADEIKNSRAYDIRPAGLKKKSPLKYTKQLEFRDYSRISSEILSPEEMQKFKIRFIKNALPKNKEEPINIISGCPGEYSAYNTVTLLASMGYKKIAWFPGGISEFGKNPHPCLTPEKVPSVSIVNAEQVRDFLQDKKKNVVIDVRSEKKFTLVGSKALAFPEKRNGLSMPVYRGNITAEGLTTHKEGYRVKVNIPNTKTIILVGENEYDWRAYKAAVFFQSKGYKNIYWYRKGMRDWAQKVLFHPNQYKLNRAVKSGELY